MDYYNTIVLNKKNLLHNLKVLKRIQPNKKICAMIKANAYGHGIKECVLILKKHVDFFGVANCVEALKTREFAKQTKILLCGAYKSEKLEELIKNDISLTVFNKVQLNEIIKVAKSLNKTVNIHIKINTGMNRLGVKSKAYFKQMLNKIEINNKYIVLQGVYSHFFASDTSKALTENQYYKFMEYTNLIKNKERIIIHIENTSAYINKADKFNICSMARLGIGLYGYNPTELKLDLKKVLTLKSKVVAINKLNKSEYIGYGTKFVSNKKMKVAVVPIGYYDGILRNYRGSNVLINNVPCPILSVCMDMIIINVTHVKTKINDEVILIGDSKDYSISANYLACIAKTISYEVLTNIKHERINIKVI